jgi:5'-nucleotidase (lipoprotein e(P4) family)
MNASAEYRAAAAAAFAEATRAVEARAAGRPAGSWAVIVDADETVLSNVAYLRGLERRGDEDSDEAWTQWVKRRAAVPLPGALAFLGRVRELGGRIAVVTNREHGECEDTIANLREKAVPFDVVLCKPEDGSGDKNPRFESVARGTAAPGLPPAEVLVWVGDNIRDFPGLGQDLRSAPEAALLDFGRRFFIVPNPAYGSWEENTEE